MSRPYASAYAAAKAYAGNRRIADINRYADRLIRSGLLEPAPPSKKALRAGPAAVRAEAWRGHRWVLKRRRTT